MQSEGAEGGELSPGTDLIVQHVKKPPPSPRDLVPELPDALAQVVVRMMAKPPDDRPSLAKVRTVLAELRDGRPAVPAAPAVVASIAPVEARAAEPAAAPTRQMPVALIAVAALLAAMVGLGVVLLAR